MFEVATLDDALTTLGDLLADAGHAFELVAIGGGALLILNLIDRSTKDIDVDARVESGRWHGARPLPQALQQAVGDVAAALDLPSDWLNAGYGALTLHIASRADQISLKLYAAADHWPSKSRHLSDLCQLQPTQTELLTAADWCRSHDPSEGFEAQPLGPLLAHLSVGGADV